MFAEVEKTERDYTKQQDQAFILDPLVSHCLPLMVTCSDVLDCFESIVSQRFGSSGLTAATEISQCHKHKCQIQFPEVHQRQGR